MLLHIIFKSTKGLFFRQRASFFRPFTYKAFGIKFLSHNFVLKGNYYDFKSPYQHVNKGFMLIKNIIQ